MSGETVETLVFRDGSGGLYLLPCDVLLQHRVPAEDRTAAEQSIAAVDVVGFGYPTSPVPPRPPSAAPFPGLRFLGQWPFHASYARALPVSPQDGRGA
jgi:hypothetical protein